jgi:hypothetical protein
MGAGKTNEKRCSLYSLLPSAGPLPLGEGVRKEITVGAFTFAFPEIKKRRAIARLSTFSLEQFVSTD